MDKNLKKSSLLLILITTLTACSNNEEPEEVTEPDPITYKITTSVGGFGDIEPESIVVNAGGSAEFKLYAHGYYVLDEVIGCNGTLSGDTYAVDNVLSDCQITVNFTEMPRNQGGTLSSPSPLSFTKQNEIVADHSNNYFSVELNSGDRLYLFSSLPDSNITTDGISKCEDHPELYGYGLHIIDEQNSCGYSLAHTQEVAAQQVIHISYPDSIYGFFNADVVPSSGVEVQPADGKGGKPSQPKEFLFGHENGIYYDQMINFYAYHAKAGEVININTYPGAYIEEDIKLGCNIDPSFNSVFGIGVSVNDGDYSCTEQFEYTFPEDGLYIFHLKFLHGTYDINEMGGVFYVEIIPN
ncbi:MAG: hypothetical protein HUJ16_08510 [Kangiella sp.]|nr:hypothetical protein [Kangiella sp.]